MATWLKETRFPQGNGSHFILRLYYDISQSVDGNYSDVTFYEYFVSVDGYSGSGAATNGYINNNWVGSTTSIGKNATVFIGQRTDRYNHNADGTGSASYSASLSSPWGIGTASLSGTLSLPTIPRASNIGNQTLTINEAKTISWSRASNSFKHILKYSFGSASGTIGSNLDTSVSWKPPTSLYQQMSGKSKTGTLTLETYNGGTKIGSKNATLTLNAKESECKPTQTSLNVIDTNTTTVNLTGDNKKVIKYKSNAKITFVFNTRQYSTLKSVTVNGTNVTSSAVKGTTSSGTTPYTLTYTINGISTNSLNLIVTDTRGYTYSTTKTLTMINYIQLSANTTFFRPQPTTGAIDLSFTGNYFNGSLGNTNNTLTLQYKYKKASDSSYSSLITLTNNTDYKISGNTYFSGNGSSQSAINVGNSFDYQDDYEFVFYYKDKLSSGSKTITVPKGIPIIQWNKEKFQVNGNIFLADTNGNNKYNLKNIIELYNDTSGSNWETMLQNKIDYCIDNIDTSKTNVEAFVNGGWYGVNYGFGLFSKTGSVYQLVWFSFGKIYYCRLYNGNYSYDQVNEGRKVLFSGETTGGTDVLSDNVANYNYIEVFYKTNEDILSSTKVYTNYSSNFVVDCKDNNMITDSKLYAKYTNYRFNGKNIILGGRGEFELATDYIKYNNDNKITITKVVGYNINE